MRYPQDVADQIATVRKHIESVSGIMPTNTGVVRLCLAEKIERIEGNAKDD